MKSVQVFDGDGKPQDFLDHLMADVESCIKNDKFYFGEGDREWMQQVARRFYAQLLELKMSMTYGIEMSGEFVQKLVDHHQQMQLPINAIAEDQNDNPWITR